jgi:hypothetical protein
LSNGAGGFVSKWAGGWAGHSRRGVRHALLIPRLIYFSVVAAIAIARCVHCTVKLDEMPSWCLVNIAPWHVGYGLLPVAAKYCNH